MKKDIVKTISRNAVVAAIYFFLTFIGQSVGFGPVQIRISEALVLLCFFRRDYVFGITLGCFLSNLFSPFMPWDLLIGTLSTFISCILVSFCRHLFLSTFIPVIVNGFGIGAELTFLFKYGSQGFWITSSLIILGEFLAVSVIGYLLFLLVKGNNSFFKAIGANRNTEYKW